jgi:hypothetical protein
MSPTNTAAAAKPVDGRPPRPGRRPPAERTTADGHRIDFGLAMQALARPPALHWLGDAGHLLLLTGLAYAYVRRLLRPLDDIGAGAALWRGDFAQPIPVRRRTSWATWPPT